MRLSLLYSKCVCVCFLPSVRCWSVWLSVSVFVSESPFSSHLSGQDDVTFYSLLSVHKFPVLLGEREREREREGRAREVRRQAEGERESGWVILPNKHSVFLSRVSLWLIV